MYWWKVYCEDGAYDDESEEYFETKREAYDDMRNAVLDKMKWNTEYDEDFTNTDEIAYKVIFRPDRIIHQSYSGLYIYEIKERGGDMNKFYLYDVVRERLNAILITRKSKKFVESIIENHFDESWGDIEDYLNNENIGVIWNADDKISIKVADTIMNAENTIDWTTV